MRAGFRLGFRAPAALAHLLHVLPDLRALLRRENVEQLPVQLSARLTVGWTALGMSLAELLYELLHLRLLLDRQIDAVHHAHESVPPAVPMAVRAALGVSAGGCGRRRLAGLLRKYRRRGNERSAHYCGKKKISKNVHLVVNSVEKRLLSQ